MIFQAPSHISRSDQEATIVQSAANFHAQLRHSSPDQHAINHAELPSSSLSSNMRRHGFKQLELSANSYSTDNTIQRAHFWLHPLLFQLKTSTTTTVSSILLHHINRGVDSSKMTDDDRTSVHAQAQLNHKRVQYVGTPRNQRSHHIFKGITSASEGCGRLREVPATRTISLYI